MSSGINTQDLAGRVKSVTLALRIIVAALALGVLSFACAALFIRHNGNVQPDPALRFMTWIALAAAAAALVASRLVPLAIVKNSRRAIAAGSYRSPGPSVPGSMNAALSDLGDAGKLAIVYQTTTIVSAALLEGTAFLNIVTYLINGDLTPLVVGASVVLALAALFPSTTRLANWIDQQQRLLADEKMLGV